MKLRIALFAALIFVSGFALAQKTSESQKDSISNRTNAGERDTKIDTARNPTTAELLQKIEALQRKMDALGKAQKKQAASQESQKDKVSTDCTKKLKPIKPADVMDLMDATRSVIIAGKNESEKDRAIIDKYWRTTETLRDKLLANLKPTGKVNLGYRGDIASNNKLHVIDGGFDLRIGTYPWQLKLKSQISASISDKKLKEDISSLHLAYDFHLRKWNQPLNWEYFVFVDRFENAYMGVEERYELGAGFIYRVYGEHLTQKGDEEWKPLKEEATLNIDDDQVITCIDGKCRNFETDELSEKQIQNFTCGIPQVKNYVKKKYAKFKVGILLGAFVEMERIPGVDTITQEFVENTFEFDQTVKLRGEARPSLELDFEVMKISAKPYFKFPISFKNYTQRVDGKRKLDYRFELPIVIEVPLNDKSSVSLNYYWYYDNTPNSVPMDRFQPLSNPSYITAQDSHENIALKLNFTFM